MDIPIEGIEGKVMGDTLVISSEEPMKVLSSAVLGGGITETRYILNHHVDKGYRSDNPVQDLKGVSRETGIEEKVVGMMTAVDMENVVVKTFGEVTAVVTGGVTNALAAGEEVEWGTSGTINIILLIDADLTDAAMVNSVIVATEAKTLALGDLDVKSTVSEARATGTTSDAIVVACTWKGEILRYAGTATDVGRAIALAVREAVREAIIKQDKVRK